ncbi:MAG: ABC transporter ATP-binding protein [Clostridia bacterium]|nr:ABC transporter ATP-binding protein [Clostridia bacterium]
MKVKIHLQLLARVWVHAPVYAALFLVEGVLMGVNQAIGTYHIHHIFDLIEEQAGFAPIMHILVEFAVYLLVHYAFYHWFRDCYQPRAKERMHVSLGEGIAQNTAYTAEEVRRMTSQVDELLEDMGHIVTHTMAGIAIAVLLFRANVLAACICLFACAVRLSVVLFHNHLAVRHHEELAQLEEISGAFNLKADALRDYSHRKRALISEGNRRLARVTFAAEGSMMLIDFGVILLMLYQYAVKHTVSLGDVAVFMTALWILSWQVRGLFERLQHFCQS